MNDTVFSKKTILRRLGLILVIEMKNCLTRF